MSNHQSAQYYSDIFSSSSHAGLARLGGLLCAGPGFSEDDIISRYGSTQLTAEAFWLLGRLNKY